MALQLFISFLVQFGKLFVADMAYQAAHQKLRQKESAKVELGTKSRPQGQGYVQIGLRQSAVSSALNFDQAADHVRGLHPGLVELAEEETCSEEEYVCKARNFGDELD